MDRPRACNELGLAILMNMIFFVNMINLENNTLLRDW